MGRDDASGGWRSPSFILFWSSGRLASGDAASTVPSPQNDLNAACSRYPAPFFWIPVLLTVFSAIGLLLFKEENRIWYLYSLLSPSGAASHYEHSVANEFFNDRGGKFWLEARFFQINYLIKEALSSRIAITTRDMGNLLRENYFDEVEALASYLQYNFTTDCLIGDEETKCAFAELCSGSSCSENQVIPLFNLIYRNASSRLHPNFRLTYPTMHLYNDEYYVAEHFAGVEIDKNTNVISSVKVVVLYFRTDRQSEENAKNLQRWESSIFDYVEQFQHPVLNITCNSDALIAREVRKNGLACLPYFGISVTLVYCFILITNRREHFRFGHSVCMGFLGIAGPLMAVGTTFCLLFLFGIPFNSITLVMPFLIIGVGSDDVFIIIHAMRKTNKKMSLEDQIAETMEEAGPSITVTSVTNILSFGIGVLTPTPAISLFCLYTCVGLAVDFVYQVSSLHPNFFQI
uniref:SSD domain-containing protein n=1 Tax=Angiostrongylus cantonensis TaxID=6313 RepID=A0A158P8C5_ANGCA